LQQPLMKVLVRVRKSQAFVLVPGSNRPNEAYARVNVSWTKSSASAWLRVSRKATEYS
jgi:hypothetical protein